MKITLLFPVLLLSTILLTSCGPAPVQSVSTPSGTTTMVEFLFEQDGVKLYRFYDYGRTIYFTTSTRGSSQAMWYQPERKTSRYVRVASIP